MSIEIKDTDKVSYCRISPATNGWTVNFDLVTKRPGSGHFDDCCHDSKEIVFTDDQEAEAFELFMKLKKREKAQMNEPSPEDNSPVKMG